VEARLVPMSIIGWIVLGLIAGLLPARSCTSEVKASGSISL
jgi:uncharacterized membrane protein YeaQ/YmgE (transglycosylase-associated protein family)